MKTSWIDILGLLEKENIVCLAPSHSVHTHRIAPRSVAHAPTQDGIDRLLLMMVAGAKLEEHADGAYRKADQPSSTLRGLSNTYWRKLLCMDLRIRRAHQLVSVQGDMHISVGVGVTRHVTYIQAPPAKPSPAQLRREPAPTTS